jgi:CDP-diacylglycerol--glycerol-3-phosphate 3-phosphatidyltransferase
MNYSLPNIISFTRIIIAPIFYVLLTHNDIKSINIACVIFIIGALSDYFDGMLARLRKEVSDFGSFFDPLADKVLTSAAFFAFVSMNIIPLWMIIIITTRDIITTLLRLYADTLGTPIITSKAAKTKTFVQMVYIFIVLIYLIILNNSSLSISVVNYKSTIEHSIYLAMLGITILTIYTSVEYFIQNSILLRSLLKSDWIAISKIGIGSFIGAGYSSIAPGTIASTLALLIVIFNAQPYIIMIMTITACILGLWSVPYLENHWGNDASKIVIDEVVGMWLILSVPIFPKTWIWNVIALIFFRLFDITKPFPISWLNSRKGSIWVFADDIVAALYTIMIMYLLLWMSVFLPFFKYLM